MTKIEINGSQSDVLRVFHLDLPREAVERFTTQAGTGEWPLKYGLGATALRAKFVDVVEIRDLGAMSLSDYMIQAHSVTKAALKDHRVQLDALDGVVLLLPSQAFENTSQTLTVSTPLTHVGSYGETRAKPRGAPLQSRSATGSSGAMGAVSLGRGGSLALKLVLIGVGILVLLVLALILR